MFSKQSEAFNFQNFLPLRPNHGGPSGDANLGKSPSLGFGNVGMSATSLSTTLLSLLEAAGTVINLSIPILSTNVFKVTKSDFAISTSCSF